MPATTATSSGRRKWLEGIVAADRDAGGARTDRSRYLAAVATLELTSASRDAFQSIPLVAPLKQTLADKKAAMERALAGYQQATGYAVAEVTTAATYEMGELYRRLAADLMKSERPANLDAEELEQYDLLLEEQAFPFEEKAAEIHELNARHAKDGLYDESVRKSYAVLAEVQPARFGKQVEAEAVHRGPRAARGCCNAAGRRAGDRGDARRAGRTRKRPRPCRRRPQSRLRRSSSSRKRCGSSMPATLPPRDRSSRDSSRASRRLPPPPSTSACCMRARSAGRRPRLHSPKASAAILQSAVAFNELASVQRETGRFKEAEGSYIQALAADPEHYRTYRNFAVLLDLYLWRPAEALQNLEAYLSKSGTADRQVSGWIAELKRRVGDVAQTAEVQP